MDSAESEQPGLSTRPAKIPMLLKRVSAKLHINIQFATIYIVNNFYKSIRNKCAKILLCSSLR